MNETRFYLLILLNKYLKKINKNLYYLNSLIFLLLFNFVLINI